MNGIFKGKGYGAVTVGERGQLVIPSELRKELKLKTGHKLMVFANLDKKIISLIKEEDFTEFLHRASQLINKLEDEVSGKGRSR